MKYNKTLLAEALRVRETKTMTWEDTATYVYDRYKVLVTGNALRKACNSYLEMENRLDDAKEKTDTEFFVPFVQDYTDIITVPYVDSIIISDVHLPFYKHDLAEKMLGVAKKHNIKRLFVGGDTFDAKAYSRFPTANDISQDDSEYELQCVTQFFQACASQFDDIFVCIGNHEMRMLNKMERKLKFKTLLKMAIYGAEIGNTKIHITEYPVMKMKGDKKADTLIGHPGHYSIVKTNIPRDLATKFLCNIASGHSHHLALTTHISGKFWIAETGCLADPDKQEYLAMDWRKNPVHTPGFMMIKNECPFIFDNGLLTDWNTWLGDE